MKTKKIILWSALLIIGLLTFILQIFVFQKPDGILGFLICITSIFLILGSIIRLCFLRPKLVDWLLNLLDML